MRKNALYTLCMTVLLYFGTSTALAGSKDMAFWNAKHHYFNLGVEASTLNGFNGAGWQPSVGMRTSLVGLWVEPGRGFIQMPKPPPWWGFYGTAHYDLGDARWRASMGTGAGIAIGGMEVGAVAQQTGTSWTPGVEVAALLTLGYGGLFVRNTTTLDRGVGLEVGIRGNMPVWEKGRRAKRQELAQHQQLKSAVTQRLAALEVRNLTVLRPPPPPNVSDLPCYYRFPTGERRTFGPLHSEAIAARMDGWELSCKDLSAGYEARALWILGEGPEPGNIRNNSLHTVRDWLYREVYDAALNVALADQTDDQGNSLTGEDLSKLAKSRLLASKNYEIGPLLDDDRPAGALTLELLSDHSGSFSLKIYSRPAGCPDRTQMVLEHNGALVANEPQVVEVAVRPPDLRPYITHMRTRRNQAPTCADVWGTPWLQDRSSWQTYIVLDQRTPEGPVHRVIKRWSNGDRGCVAASRLSQDEYMFKFSHNLGKGCVLLPPGGLP